MTVSRLRITSLTLSVIVASGGNKWSVEPTRVLVPNRATRTILDGAHGGSTRLYLLPPLVPPPTFNGTFDPSAFGRVSSDMVYVCVVTGASCANRVASFTAGTSSSSVQMDPSTQNYHVSWNTALNAPPLSRTSLYRIVVVVRGAVVGYADVIPEVNGLPPRVIDRTKYAVVIIGSVVQIRFRLEVPLPNVIDVAMGPWFTCALDATTRTFCWGDLGYGTGVNFTLTPALLGGGANFSSLAHGGAGAQHACALDANHAAYCWGQNLNGELGNGTSGGVRPTPGPVIGGLSFRAVTGGLFHSCGLTTAGVAYCWGDNANGELGNRSTVSAVQPVRVATKLTFKAIQAGAVHTCALTIEGKALCWGANDQGQLGDGTTTNRLVPTPVPGNFSSLGLGWAHTCAVTTQARAYCWGTNVAGQLGDGTTVSRSTPGPVHGAFAFSQLTGGLEHTCGVTTAGAGYCWGYNSQGELGDGTTTPRLLPTPVAGGPVLTEIMAGQVHTCAIGADGGLRCWGVNTSAQIGDGTRTNRLVPTFVRVP